VPIAIAIDGPAGSGKGTAARRLAQALGYGWIDTGAMYRAVAWAARERGVSWDDEAGLGALAARLCLVFGQDEERLTLHVDGVDVTDAIRADAVGTGASRVSRWPAVRSALLGQQRALGAAGGVVMDGRDIGTVVLTDAALKVFLDADLDERARRRTEELRGRGENVDPDAIREAMARRDAEDTQRVVAPLCAAADAVHLDATALSPDEVVAALLGLARARGA
jgi:cytidylate kinase